MKERLTTLLGEVRSTILRLWSTRKRLFGVVAAVVVLAVSGLLTELLGHRSWPKRIYLYAWERPEDFSFLSDIRRKPETGIVYYAGGILRSAEGELLFHTRTNEIWAPDGITVIPLIRIDIARQVDYWQGPLTGVDWSEDQGERKNANREKILNFLESMCRDHAECQIDYDVREGYWREYIDIMDGLKERLPDVVLSITALASWCSGPSEIDDMPITYAVPMMYRLGVDESIHKRKTPEWGIWERSICKGRAALSLDELDFDFRMFTKDADVFLFSPDSWTEDSYRDVLEKL